MTDITITDRSKMEAVIQQRKLFTSYIARLQSEGRLTREQDEAAVISTVNLDAVIDEYRAKLGLHP